MEINGSDPIIKKSLYTEKKKQKEKVTRTNDSNEKTETKRAGNSNETIKELQATVQKSILKSQAIIGGLENLRNLSDSTDDEEEKAQILQEIINKTVFDNQQVLKTYKTLLTTALLEENPAAIDEIIFTETEKIKNYSSKEQNIISIGSSLHVENPEALLHSIIRHLKENGEPEINLPINKVLDLLEE